jgi:hypothetical protein
MDNMLTELKRYCEQLLIHVKVFAHCVRGAGFPRE